MNEKTQASYRKLAENFYKTRLDGQQPTPKRIADALQKSAPEYRPAYWRRLRNALAFDQREKGFGASADRIAATANPVTKKGSGIAVKPKQRRVNRISEADEGRLVEYFSKRGDTEVTAALCIAKYTGARPVEMAGIVVVAPGKVLIPGAKKSHGGMRGADRIIELPPEVAEQVGKAVDLLPTEMSSVQNKLAFAGKKLWPQRKATPTLYSWRHQMGADLKASGMSRDELAYVMGHQATESADRYGNPRTARGGRVLPKPDTEADLSRIRIDHDKPPAGPAAAVEKGIDLLQVVTAMRSEGLVSKTTFGEAVRKIHNEKVQTRQGLGQSFDL